jgi:hypothetical protein
MNYILPLIGGITCKIYDDLSDNNLLSNEILKECLKAIQWITLTLMSYNDFNFTVIVLIVNGANAFFNIDEWNKGYETSLLILYPIFLAISYSTRKCISLIEGVYLLVILCSMIWDPIVITEEYSHRKFIQRVLISILSIIAFIGTMYFGMSITFIKLTLYSVGYFVMSSIFQLYMLEKDNDKLLQTMVLHG